MLNIDLSQATESVNGCESYFLTGCAYDTESTTESHIEKVTKTTVDDMTGEKVKKEVEQIVIDNCFVYHIQFAIGDKYYSFRSFTDFFKFFSLLLDTVKAANQMYDRNSKLIIWVANMAHEWAFMKNYLSEFNITKIFAKTKRDALLIEVANCIQFREAIGLFGHSLADIAKNWCAINKKQKGDLDYTKTRTFMTELDEVEQGYCRADVLILTEMHNNVFKAYTRPDGVIYIPYTVSGFVRLKLKDAIEHDDGLTAARQNLGKKWQKRNNVSLLKARNRNLFTTADDWNILRTYGFSGGVVGSNILKVGKVLNNVKCADITSDYPFQMLTKRFPTGSIKAGTHGDWLNCLKEKKPVFALLHITEMSAKTQHAFFSKHKIVNDNELKYKEIFGGCKQPIINNGKILQAFNVVAVMNDVDYQVYSKAYDLIGVTCLHCWYFPSGYRRLPEWLTSCVIKDYITKAKLKKLYGSHKAQTMTEYRDSKSRVNTYFGTLATRCEDVFEALDALKLFEPEKEFTFNDLKFNTWLSPYWAFYITSYARQMLIENILAHPGAVVQYDTDSIYYIQNKDGKQLEKELQQFNEAQSDKNRRQFKNVPDYEYLLDLGSWDFDDVYKKFLCMGAKKYIKTQGKEMETVIAGLPKDAIPKEIITKQLQEPFNYYNPITTGEIIIEHRFHGKLASVYNDINHTEYKMITDYNGVTACQPVTSFHALIPIDFTLKVAPEYMKLIKYMNRVKQLKDE